MLKNVVLPAPFGPIRPTMRPVGIAKSTSFTAIRPPNTLRTRSAARMTSVAADVGNAGSGSFGEGVAVVTGSGVCVVVLDVVLRLVVHPLFELRLAARLREEALRPEEHDAEQDDPEDQERVLGDVEVRAEAVVHVRADGRQPEAVEVREEHRPDDHP